MLGRRERAYRAALYDDDARRALAIAGNAIEIGAELEEAKPKSVGESLVEAHQARTDDTRARDAGLITSWLDVAEASRESEHFASVTSVSASSVSPSLAFSPHTPHPKQQEFLDLQAEEAFYGGAAGGGKSDAILMGALQYVHVPGYASLILRQSYEDLKKPGALIDRSKTWLMNREGCKWSAQDRQWTFTTPSGGNAYLQFGYLDSEDDKYKYQSTEYQYVGFDELTHFRETQYTYLFSRLRKPIDPAVPLSHVPLRMRSGSNPGGRGHAWVKKRFVKPGALDRIFVPARLSDNPSLDAESYMRQLGKLDERERRQLLEGSWEDPAPKYGEVTKVIAEAPIPPTYTILRVDESRAVRVGFALVNERVTLVSVDPYAVPSRQDRIMVCKASVAKELRKETKTRAMHVEPKQLRSMYLFEVCKRVDVLGGDDLDPVWGALGAEESDLSPIDAGILDAMAHAPTIKQISIRVDRMDLSEEQLLEMENGSTSTDEWWRPLQSIGLPMR